MDGESFMKWLPLGNVATGGRGKRLVKSQLSETGKIEAIVAEIEA